ncbi:MAG TPA: hypothetical protein PLY59_06720 [Clostridiales bacterium]|nr:hypothetical protein [Clostridiales bacterium]HQD31270.1 hypothetical protein [Clostridiales bacterium]
MGDIRKLPFLSGCSAALLAGIISYAAGVDNQVIYIRMAVMMFLFYMLGVFVRNAIVKTRNELDEKKRERELEEAKRKRKEREEKIKEALAARKGAAKLSFEEDGKMEDALDLEGFRTLSEMISTKAEE